MSFPTLTFTTDKAPPPHPPPTTKRVAASLRPQPNDDVLVTQAAPDREERGKLCMTCTYSQDSGSLTSVSRPPLARALAHLVNIEQRLDGQRVHLFLDFTYIFHRGPFASGERLLGKSRSQNNESLVGFVVEYTQAKMLALGCSSATVVLDSNIHLSLLRESVVVPRRVKAASPVMKSFVTVCKHTFSHLLQQHPTPRCHAKRPANTHLPGYFIDDEFLALLGPRLAAIDAHLFVRAEGDIALNLAVQQVSW